MNVQENFKQLDVIYFALLAGQILFAGVSIFLNDFRMEMGIENNIFLYIIPLMGFGVILLDGWIQGKRKEEAAKMETGLDEKIMHYRQTTLIRSALIEGVNLLAIVGYFLTSNLYLLVFLGLGLLLFLQVKPSKAHFIKLYKLASSDRDSILRK